MKNLVLNSLHSVGVTSLLRAAKKNRLTVLSLHRISDERNPFWDPIRPKTFDLLLKYVKKNYRVISLAELAQLNTVSSGKPYLILSFDDGYYDFYEHALPLLVKHGLPSNHNIVNECAERNMVVWTERLNVLFEHGMKNSMPIEIELSDRKLALSDFGNAWMPFYLETFKQLLNVPVDLREEVISDLENNLETKAERRMMNWDEIRDCSSQNVEIGSHTFSHDSLGTIADKASLEKQLLFSKEDIANKLGKPVDVLALPNGQTGKMADDVISNSDYKFVLYANDELNDLPMNGNLPLKISRINLVDEPFPHMALRMEQFHKMLRRYV